MIESERIGVAQLRKNTRQYLSSGGVTVIENHGRVRAILVSLTDYHWSDLRGYHQALQGAAKAAVSAIAELLGAK